MNKKELAFYKGFFGAKFKNLSKVALNCISDVVGSNRTKEKFVMYSCDTMYGYGLDTISKALKLLLDKGYIKNTIHKDVLLSDFLVGKLTFPEVKEFEIIWTEKGKDLCTMEEYTITKEDIK